MKILLLIISAFITSSISAVLGMGGGIILLGIMAIMIPNGYKVIALHGIIQLISNTTRTFVFRKYLNKNLIKEFFIGALIGAGLSCMIIILLIKYFQVNSASEIKVDFLKPIIGFFIIWYLFIKSSNKIEKKSESFIKVGGISGLASIFVGATGPLIAPFFLNENLTKEEIIGNKAACQMVSHITKIPIFIYFFNMSYIKESAILLPLIIAVFVGTNVGKKILDLIPEIIFKKLFKITLFIIAIKLIFSY
tara:strand:+ start:3334 stop:4083 length:750 start_codon:yes stop_codon:yes gene_type:complete